MNTRATAGGRIVVGYDGSETAMDVVRWAADEARSSGCTLELLLAYDDAVPALSFGLSMSDSLPSQRAIARQARELAQEAALRISAPGLSVTTVAVPGRPGPALVAAASGARLLVIGGSHRSALGRLLAGSTVSHCQRNAPCPVVVVRTKPPVHGDQVNPLVSSG